VMSGVLQAVGLALLGLGGAFFLGAKNNPFSLLFTLGGFVALLLLAQAVASRPELIDGIGCRVLSWFNSIRGRPADTGLAKWREILSQLESVSLSRRDLALAFSWSLINRFSDVACLGFAAFAAGYHPSVGGLTVACAAARAVGTIPLMPGGLLVVEAVLVPGLVSSGMPLSGAVSTMLIYRLISWVLLAAVGWVVFFFMFRTESEPEPDAQDTHTETDQTDRESGVGPAATGPPGDSASTLRNGHRSGPVDPADGALQGPVPPPDPAAQTGEAAAPRQHTALPKTSRPTT
jgi:putative heme transporter